MTIPIRKESDSPPFNMVRSVINRAKANRSPRVSKVVLTGMNIRNIKYVEWPKQDYASKVSIFCSIHQNCLGHLFSNDGVRIALPSYCLRLDNYEDMSNKDRLTVQYMSNNCTMLDYASGIRKDMAGKRGILKYKCMGFTTPTSCRGVATCYWGSDHRHVMIPRTWMNRIKVPTRKESSGLVSSYYSSRSVVDGDYAILSRAPALSHKSVQCVRVYGWDNPSVGVHPEMCSPLNLDFDGDEVHIAIVDGIEAIEEVKISMADNPISFFSDESFNRALSASGIQDKDPEIDPMIYSTMSVTQSRDSDPDTPIHKLSRCKKELWSIIREGLTKRNQRIRSFVSKSITAIHALTESHIRVSEGFTIGRQLKHITLQTSTVRGVCRTRWVPPESVNVSTYRISDSIGTECGYPGTKLASLLSEKIQQALMDKAKHSVEESAHDAIYSLMTDGSGFVISRRSNEEKYILHKSSDMAPFGYDDWITSSRQNIRSFMSSSETIAKLMSLIVFECKRMRVPYTDMQVFELACCICASVHISARKWLTSTRHSKFLSKTFSPMLISAACDDIYVLDTRFEEDWGNRSAVNRGFYTSTTDISYAIGALIIGNYTLEASKSVIYHRKSPLPL